MTIAGKSPFSKGNASSFMVDFPAIVMLAFGVGNIMNLINTFKLCTIPVEKKRKNVKRQRTSESVFCRWFQRASCAKTKWPAVSSSLPERQEMEDHVSRISLEFLHLFLKKLLIVSFCPPKKIREVEDSRSKWPYLISR